MLNVYTMPSQSRELRALDKIEKGAWINLENPSDKELEEVAAVTGVSEDLLKAALDEE